MNIEKTDFYGHASPRIILRILALGEELEEIGLFRQSDNALLCARTCLAENQTRTSQMVPPATNPSPLPVLTNQQNQQSSGSGQGMQEVQTFLKSLSTQLQGLAMRSKMTPLGPAIASLGANVQHFIQTVGSGASGSQSGGQNQAFTVNPLTSTVNTGGPKIYNQDTSQMAWLPNNSDVTLTMPEHGHNTGGQDSVHQQ